MRHLLPLFSFAVLASLCGCVQPTKAPSPYGVCAHVTRGGEAEIQVAELGLMRQADIAWVRSDFDWSGIQSKADGAWDFTRLDTVISNAEQHGVQILPILGYDTEFANPAFTHLPLWENYVRAVSARYCGRLPVLELWNEQNINGFGKDSNPTNYLPLLRSTYATVKAVDPKLTLAVGGFAGVPTNYIDRLYQLGGGPYFDVMNVHPYGQPSPPESYLENQLADLKATMAKYGDAAKPIWITEFGWPTQKQRIAAPGVIKAGLKAARPDKNDAWRIAVFEGPGLAAPSEDVLKSELPGSARIQRLAFDALSAALDARAVDAVVLPFSEEFPADGFDKLIDFVRQGGVLIDCGGMPLWAPLTRGPDGKWVKSTRYGEAFRDPLRIGVEAWWYKKDVIPERMPVRFVGPAADLPMPKNGIAAERFLTPQNFKPGDRFIPLLSGEHNGYTGTAAAVYAYNSDLKGAVIVSSLFERGLQGSTEAEQAKLLPRALLIALHFGVVRTFWYEFQAPEVDDLDQESHFGIVHSDLSPKPAYLAYKTLTAQRPAGSAALDRPWKSADGALYYPQWKLPGGSPAGAVWAYRKAGRYALTFSTKKVALVNHAGAAVQAEWRGRVCTLPLTDEPIYFKGGTLEATAAAP